MDTEQRNHAWYCPACQDDLDVRSVDDWNRHMETFHLPALPALPHRELYARRGVPWMNLTRIHPSIPLGLGRQ